MKQFLAPTADNYARNLNIQCSNYHTSLLTIRRKWLSHRETKYWAIYKYLPLNIIVRLRHPRSQDNQGQETFLAPSADKKTHNHNIQSSNHHSSISSLRPKGLCLSKIQWWAIYTNLQVNDIVRLRDPLNGYSQGQKTFLARSADKQIRNHDIECSNHHPSPSTLRPKRLSCSKMKWWPI